jgi:hypothetical protein
MLTVVGTVASSALAAYGFARVDWRGRDKVFLVALATMMVPFPVVMVPMYCLFRWLGWIGTLKPLWVGSFFAGAFNVFLLRQFFMTIPKDLSEAARIDGCSEFRIFWQIILPLCRPALMVVALFQFMYTWNDFLGPLIYLTKQEDYTLALGPAVLPEPARRHGMALPDGRQHARGPADHRPVLLHPKDLHRGHLDDRHQGITAMTHGNRTWPRAAISAAVVFCWCRCFPGVFPKRNLHQRRRRFHPFTRRARRLWMTRTGPSVLHGCNLGNWLLNEMWMMDLAHQGEPGDQWEMEELLKQRFGAQEKDRLLDVFRENWIRPRDYDIIKSWGFNVVRVPFNYTLLEDDATPGGCVRRHFNGSIAPSTWPREPAST